MSSYGSKVWADIEAIFLWRSSSIALPVQRYEAGERSTKKVCQLAVKTEHNMTSERKLS